MDSNFYHIERGIIVLKSSGFVSVEQIRERVTVVRKLVEAAKRERGYAHILDLAHDFPVQSSDVANSFSQEALIRDPLDGPNDKYAIVLSSSLARMQIQRTIGSGKRQVFTTEAEARAWLAGK